jgi:hypothetical protein
MGEGGRHARSGTSDQAAALSGRPKAVLTDSSRFVSDWTNALELLLYRFALRLFGDSVNSYYGGAIVGNR